LEDPGKNLVVPLLTKIERITVHFKLPLARSSTPSFYAPAKASFGWITRSEMAKDDDAWVSQARGSGENIHHTPWLEALDDLTNTFLAVKGKAVASRAYAASFQERTRVFSGS
jgi:hypothetical protein